MFGPRILRESMAPSPWRASWVGVSVAFARWLLRTVLAVDTEAVGETGDRGRYGLFGEGARAVLVLTKGDPGGCCLVREEVNTKEVVVPPGVAGAGGAW